jgi:GT2 family glycosyltransferase
LTHPASAAVIIPHRNDVARLGRCLDALMPQVGAGIEVVVVDNASTESLDGVRVAHPRVRIVTEPRAGAAHARNRGVAETAAPLLLLLDCDCVPAPDWLAAARAAAGRADLVGGRVDVFDETPPPRTGAQAFEAIFAFDNRSYVERKGFSVTANMTVRRDAFDAVGPFVHGLSEDVDWCRRARAKGFRLVYADDMRVSHPSRGDWPALERKTRRVTGELFALEGTGPGARLKWGLRALVMPASIAAHAPRALRHPALSGPRERLAALGTLARLRLARMAWMLRQAATGRP